jgi:uncharacterized protein YegL
MEVTVMNNKKTEIVFILDKSGSMSGLEKDTIGGFNSLLKKQQKEEGAATVTTVLFDHRYEVLHDRLEIGAINAMTEKEYYVEGTTALLDAVGRSINKIGNVQKNSKKEARADKVLFVIITDGMENASHEYSYKKISSMIENQKNKYDWEFLFLGANIDSEKVAKDIGIDASNAVNYHSDSEGTEITYAAVERAVSDIRKGKKLNNSWRNEADMDYMKRG